MIVSGKESFANRGSVRVLETKKRKKEKNKPIRMLTDFPHIITSGLAYIQLHLLVKEGNFRRKKTYAFQGVKNYSNSRHSPQTLVEGSQVYIICYVFAVKFKLLKFREHFYY